MLLNILTNCICQQLQSRKRPVNGEKVFFKYRVIARLARGVTCFAGVVTPLARGVTCLARGVSRFAKGVRHLARDVKQLSGAVECLARCVKC